MTSMSPSSTPPTFHTPARLIYASIHLAATMEAALVVAGCGYNPAASPSAIATSTGTWRCVLCAGLGSNSRRLSAAACVAFQAYASDSNRGLGLAPLSSVQHSAGGVLIEAPKGSGNVADDDALYVWFRATHIYSNYAHGDIGVGSQCTASVGGGVQILSGHVTYPRKGSNPGLATRSAPCSLRSPLLACHVSLL